jgi:hypothetical protein
MSKENATAASKAHAPEKMCSGEYPHAHNYPGRSKPAAEKVMDASHDAKALKAGKANSMGVSADGSHKGMPSSMEEIGQNS